MNRHTHGILIAALVLFLPVAAGAEEKDVEYGKYVCITDRAVGLQTTEHSTGRYAGSIVMPPDRQKFFATIQRIQKVDSSLNVIQNGLIEHYPEQCFSKESTDNFEKEWESGVSNSLGPSVDDFMEWCLARSAVELTTGSTSQKYYSTGKHIFQDHVGVNMFWIVNGWGFRWNLTDYAGDFYMLEGRCDLIK